MQFVDNITANQEEKDKDVSRINPLSPKVFNGIGYYRLEGALHIRMDELSFKRHELL
jgi:hypothetical protein